MPCVDDNASWRATGAWSWTSEVEGEATVGVGPTDGEGAGEATVGFGPTDGEGAGEATVGFGPTDGEGAGEATVGFRPTDGEGAGDEGSAEARPPRIVATKTAQPAKKTAAAVRAAR